VSDDHRRLASQREVSLVEILDRALGAGVVITGDVTLSLADVDLVYLSLRVLVGSQPLFAEERPSSMSAAAWPALDSGDGKQLGEQR
jgi:hypothetical protein